MSAPAVTVDLAVDGPFLFFIRDHETAALRFLGRVLDPGA
ncbi:MAG TPA: serpin family protein [Chloroflexota bacterium]